MILRDIKRRLFALLRDIEAYEKKQPRKRRGTHAAAERKAGRVIELHIAHRDWTYRELANELGMDADLVRYYLSPLCKASLRYLDAKHARTKLSA